MSYRINIQKEITAITGEMVGVGLGTDQNFPSVKTHAGIAGAITDISISNAAEISNALKERPYAEIYEHLRKQRAYNILMIDGALIQFRYRFDHLDNIVKHVLAFYPSPSLTEFQNEPEIYEHDILYSEVIAKDIVTTPIRFDYDALAFQDEIHPKSHFTIGQYKNCRIPVFSALTPFRFMNFVLRAFYNTPYREYCKNWKGLSDDFPKTVTINESKNLHLSIG